MTAKAPQPPPKGSKPPPSPPPPPPRTPVPSAAVVNVGLETVCKTVRHWDERRDAFVQAALQGICATDFLPMSLQDLDGHTKLGNLAIKIADETIRLLEEKEHNNGNR